MGSSSGPTTRETFSDSLADHGAWRYDLLRESTEWSDCLYRIHGVTRESFDPSGRTVLDLVHPDDVHDYRRIIRGAIDSGAPFTVQHRIVRPDGAVRTVIVRGSVIKGNDGSAGTLIGTTQDVTGKTGDEERLWHLANEDSLTGLCNRRRFMEALTRELAVARRVHAPGAVLILDVDRFKEVNDALGHMAGDALLVRVAEALRERLRVTDTLCRLGGDEFAIVLPACDVENAQRVARELSRSVSERARVTIAGSERRVTASIGIAPFGTREDESPDAVLVEADLAMYRAKTESAGAIEIFDVEMRAELAARLRTEAELREALDREQLVVLYQPIVSLADGAPIGCEALVRWDHPRRGLVGPGEFIAVAEQNGLIAELGRWVLGQACRQAKLWRRAGQNIFVSVNVSPHQFAAADVVADVQAALAEADLPPELLCLEISETSLLDRSLPMVAALARLERLGVRLAIDDFGGGASSLGTLRALPIAAIKLDRLFISGIADRRDDRAIVTAVLSLAEELELMVIAEGVEEDRQHWELRELGAKYGQGFLYSRPRPGHELELDAYTAAVQPGVGDPTVIREFMRQIGIPARVGP